MQLHNRKRERAFLFAFFFLSICFFWAYKGNAEEKKARVLYISSYSYGWETIPLQTDGVKEALSDCCELSYAFMDTKNVTYGAHYQQFYDALKYKLSQMPAYDGVLAADDAALLFVQEYKDELFPDTPIAFTGVENLENAREAAKDPLVCGVAEQVDYQKNIDIARKMQPQATHILFINDRKENGTGIQQQLEKAAASIEGCDVSYLISSDYTKEELEAKLRAIREDTIVFHVALGQGKNNVAYSESERIDIIKNNVSVPVFRVSSPNFADVFLGGYVVDHQQSAYLAAMMLRDACSGKDMADERLVEDTPGVYCFNQDVLDSCNISRALLPKGAVIKNQKPGFLGTHYRLILNLFMLVILGLLALTVVAIHGNLKLSQEANREIREKNAVLEKAVQAKAEFLSKMSHEMRTPLNSILGGMHLAKQDYDRQQDITEDLSMIERAGAFLMNLINDILDANRIEAGKLQLNKEWCSPREVIQSIEFMMIPIMEEKNIHFEYPEYKKNGIEKIEWRVDERRVQQAVINLLNNAAKFTPAGGTVRFTVHNVSHDDTTSVDRVTVSDTGCGMSKAFIAHIGEAFTQEQNEYSDKVVGSGLGLYIVKQIVALMGGELTIDSELGKGSTFSFTIRYEYRLKDAGTAEQKQALSRVELAGMKVLYAEDNTMNQTVGRRLLESRGVTVVLAANGQEAVDILRQSQPGEYQAILMDMRMPVMGGLEATQTIRKLEHPDAKTIPIIALSADAIASEIEKAKSSGLDDYITKPILPDKLFQTLQKYRMRGE